MFGFGLLGIVSTIFILKKIINETVEPIIHVDEHFDRDAYHEDVCNGTSKWTLRQRVNSGHYYIAEPKKPKIPPHDAVIDTKRYEYDKRVYGEEFAESLRRRGSYRVVVSGYKIEED